jgi:hypothetical protein
VLAAFRLAGVWLSPAILFGTAPLLLADGTRGLWPPLVLAAAASLVVVVLATPWARLAAGDRPTLLDLVRQRTPAAPDPGLPLDVAVPGTAVLFLWAQLAAARELARALGWPEAVVVGTAVAGLALAGWTERVERRVAVAGGVLAVAGLVLPLVVVGTATDPVWPRVWTAVASRPRMVFGEPGTEAPEGLPVRGPGPQAELRIGEEQRLALLGRGTVRLDPRDGGGWTREVKAPLVLILRPGDHLVLPDGFPVRFQPGRAIPGAPSTGADWVEPAAGGGSPRRLVGLAVTLLVGALGLAPVHGALPAGRPADDRAAALGGGLAAAGLAAAVLWTLYAVWLTPEIYAGGVVGSEVYELPGRIAGRVGLARPVGGLVWLGLAGGGLAAGLAALRGLPSGFTASGTVPGRLLATRLTAIGLAALLAVLGTADAWPVLLSAFGLAASACAPAAVLACWRERISPTGLGAGAGVGLAAFLALTAIQLASGGGTVDRSWLGWLAAWPALVAAPLNALTAWLLSSGPRPSPRAPLPPGLAKLHG